MRRIHLLGVLVGVGAGAGSAAAGEPLGLVGEVRLASGAEVTGLCEELAPLGEDDDRARREERDQALADAKQKNFAAALEKIKGASDDIESGLKLVGVR